MKKQLTIKNFLCLVLGAVIMQACNKKDGLPDSVTPIVFKVPNGWPKPVYNFANNPLTQQGVDLGRRLFYEGKLSKDGGFPCASCHQQLAAFGTYDPQP